MPPKVFEHDPSAKEQDEPGSSSKRRRTIERSTRATSADPDPSNAPSSSHQTVTRSSPQHTAPSREMTPPLAQESIKYTRTGRVSKATKGQRVHHCEHCGKTYTRAEHLRRHQQNHKPGAFACDVPGCERSFFREDLLNRHRARHNDPTDPPSPPGGRSEGSPDSAPGTENSGQSLTRIAGGPPAVPIQDPDNVRTALPPSSNAESPQTSNKRRGYLDLNSLPVGPAAPVLVGDSTFPFLGPSSYNGIFEESPSPSPYHSPAYDCHSLGRRPPYFQPQYSGRHTSSASLIGSYPQPFGSGSPLSAGSSTTYLPPSSFATPYPFYEGTITRAIDPYNPVPAPLNMSSDDFVSVQSFLSYRDRMEAQQLIIPPTANFEESGYTNEERYLGAYFTNVHKFFPVIHRPSFHAESASALLRTAMLALGAQSQWETADKTNATIIHERCNKVLKARTLDRSHTYFVFDMQAIVLIEIYSIFKSRRPPLQFSENFQNVYRCLADDPDVRTGTTTNSPFHSEGSRFLEDVPEVSIHDAPSKRRLFLACYILDQQHATLFGRPKLGVCDGSAPELPFPNPQSVWDSRGPSTQESMPQQVMQAIENVAWEEHGRQKYDCFQSNLLMATLLDDSKDTTEMSEHDLESSPIVSSLEKDHRCKLAYHVYIMCQNTPLRSLLAVAGQSWVMSEKLIDSKEYTAHQIESFEWASGNSLATGKSVHKAVLHARKVLQLHYDHPITGLLFQEWAIYLAAVCIWARAYVSSTTPHRDPDMSPSAPPSTPPERLDSAVMSTLVADADATIGMQQAMEVVLWTFAKIKRVNLPHNCGLTNGALDVLDKLVQKGDEMRWFGI